MLKSTQMRQALKTLKTLNIDTSLYEKLIDEVKKAEEEEKAQQIKFILILPPHIEKYIDWKARDTNTHKAEVVRAAIQNKIKNDKEFKEYNSF